MFYRFTVLEDERLTEGPDGTKVDEALINHILSGGLLKLLQDAFLKAMQLAGGMHIVAYQGPGLLAELRVCLSLGERRHLH